MIELLEHDGVTEWQCSSRTSRLFGYAASAFLTSGGILVDSGIPACASEFAALLDRHRPRGVVITHHHEDHAGNIEAVAQRGIPIWLSPLTVPFVARVAPVGIYRRLTWRPMAPLVSAVRPFDPDPLQPIATPGHATDHHVFWDATTRTLFGGDLFLGVAVRIAHHGEDPWALADSLDRVAALEPLRLFDAHRGLVQTPAAALRAKAAWVRAMIARISARVAAGDSDFTILRTVMGGESLTGVASGFEYSRLCFIRVVRKAGATT